MKDRWKWVVLVTVGLIVADMVATGYGASGRVMAQSEQADDGRSRPLSAVDENDIPEALQDDFKVGDIAAATAWADRLNLADWLGPLAPLALSPFFGVACLSGLAIWGPESITDNALLGATGPLQNVPLFVVFAVLAVLTSVPRLSKVSKPFAQAIDRVEAYAVVIILLAIKLTSSYAGGPIVGEDAVATAGWQSPIVFEAGIVSFTAETLLMIAMAINLLVINSVKFFFEFLVWLTPFPVVDALFEVGNKTTCAVLMGVYALSPTLATVLNLLILFLAALVFRWTVRRVKFYRTMLLDPILSRVWKAYGIPHPKGLVVFPQTEIGPFPAKSCLRLTRGLEGGWSLQPASSWSALSWMPVAGGGAKRSVPLHTKTPPRLVRGWLTHTLEVELNDPTDSQEGCWTLKTSRRHDQQMNVLVESLCIDLVEEQETVQEFLKTEFA